MEGMRKQENGGTKFLSNMRDGPIGGGTKHTQTVRRVKLMERPKVVLCKAQVS